jgi:3',5'-cyclic-AMP phosphodiesterase
MSVHFLQISDTHWSRNRIAGGVDTKERTERLCEWIRSLEMPIDFVVHTGDLVHCGQGADDDGGTTAEVLQRFLELPYPFHAVVGNHDHRDVWPKWMGMRSGQPLTHRSDRWAYHFVCGKERCAVLDARDAVDIDPRGRICDEQLHALRLLLEQTTEPITVFCHYPPLPLDCEWIDQSMLMVNGFELHGLLSRFSDRVRGVFFGHVHRPVALQRDGVLYVSAGSVSIHFPNGPQDRAAQVQSDAISFANYVRLGDEGTLIKTQWITW